MCRPTGNGQGINISSGLRKATHSQTLNPQKRRSIESHRQPVNARALYFLILIRERFQAVPIE